MQGMKLCGEEMHRRHDGTLMSRFGLPILLQSLLSC